MAVDTFFTTLNLANKIRRARQNSTSWMAQFPFCNDKLQLVPAAYINEPGADRN